MCPRCASDPQPANFASPRGCAFMEDGTFTPGNWNCATIGALLERQQGEEHWGDDEHMEVVSVRREFKDLDGYDDTITDGWLVLCRYKHRGCTDNAMHFTRHGCHPLTLELAEEILKTKRF